VIGLVANLTEAKRQRQPNLLQQMEADYAAHPTNFQLAFNLAAAYLQSQQTNRTVEILDQVLNHPLADANAILPIAQAFAQLGNLAKLEVTLDKLTKVAPDHAEGWYDVAALKATLGKQSEAIAALRHAWDLSSKRLRIDRNTRNLLAEAIRDQRFNVLRLTPQFQQLIAKFEVTQDELTKTAPDHPEGWYDLAALKAHLGKQADAIMALRSALELNSKRLSIDPKARNLLTEATNDPCFGALRSTREFQQLISLQQASALK
jgi:tetratricopeptide (TPR) repeat protein